MKIDLRKDRVKLRKYIEKRIRDYSVYENLGPGADELPIQLITLGYYASQGGYANLVFDTRTDAAVDGEWTLHLDNDTNTCSFPRWAKACEAFCEDDSLSLTQPDGTEDTLAGADGDEAFQAAIGEMLAGLMTELRENGVLATLPLAPDAFMVVEEFDGQFFFPDYKTHRISGRISE